MRRRLLLLPALLVFSACASLPEIRPSPELPSASDASPACGHWMPRTRMQLTQVVEAEWSSGERRVLLCALALDSEALALRGVLMTVEGVVVLDFASGANRAVSVHRSLPGLDAASLARAMDGDLRLAFFPPKGRRVAAGRTAAGLPVCRYAGVEGTVVDVARPDPDEWRLTEYDGWRRTRKTVRLREWTPHGLPGRIEIAASGHPRYTLRIRLVDAEAAPEGKGPPP